MSKKRAETVALGGMIAAVSLVLMLLTRVIPLSEMALPAMAGVLLIAAVVELGRGWAFVVYAAVGLLSLFFTFQNGAGFYYILFFGHYTILKSMVERIPGKVWQWIVKILLFNASALIMYLLMAKLAGVVDPAIRYGIPITLAAANVFFIIYDIALSRLVVLYFYRLRKLFRHSGNL